MNGERRRARRGERNTMYGRQWKRKEAPCKCWKEGGRWDESHSPLPRNNHLRDSAPGGQAPSALGHTSRGSGTHQCLGWRGPVLTARANAPESGPISFPGHAHLAVSAAAAISPYSPGDPGRGAVGARGHLGGRTEGVRGSPRPGGHGGRSPQGGPSRRRPRSRAPRPGPGWGHGGGSALRRGAGRG